MVRFTMRFRKNANVTFFVVTIFVITFLFYICSRTIYAHWLKTEYFQL